VITGFKLKQCR